MKNENLAPLKFKFTAALIALCAQKKKAADEKLIPLLKSCGLEVGLEQAEGSGN